MKNVRENASEETGGRPRQLQRRRSCRFLQVAPKTAERCHGSEPKTFSMKPENAAVSTLSLILFTAVSLYRIGWTATAVFSSSYFFKQASTLRRIQAAAAALWVLYGIAIHSAPVVVANLIVGIAAVYTSLRLALNRSAGSDL